MQLRCRLPDKNMQTIVSQNKELRTLRNWPWGIALPSLAWRVGFCFASNTGISDLWVGFCFLCLSCLCCVTARNYGGPLKNKDSQVLSKHMQAKDFTLGSPIR